MEGSIRLELDQHKIPVWPIMLLIVPVLNKMLCESERSHWDEMISLKTLVTPLLKFFLFIPTSLAPHGNCADVSPLKKLWYHA